MATNQAFEEQQLFSGAARVQGFTPQESPDLTAGLRERDKVTQANLTRFAEAENKRQTNAINRQVQTFDAIAQMGIPMAKEFAQNLAKGYLDSQVVKAQDDIRKLENFGVTPQDEEAFQSLLQQANEEEAVTSDAAYKLNVQGAPLEAVNYIKGLPRYRQLFVTQHYIDKKRREQPQRWAQYLATDTRTYRDHRGLEFTAKDIGNDRIRGSIVYDAFAQRDLATGVGISQEFNPNRVLMRPFNEQVTQTRTQYLANLDQQKNIADSQELVATSISNYLSNKNFNSLVRGYINSYDPKTGKLLDRTQARAAAEAAVVGLYAAGQIGREEAMSILKDTVEWDPKGRTYEQLYGQEIYGKDGFVAQINAVDKRKLDIEETQEQVTLKAFENRFKEVKQRLKESGARFTNENIKELVEYGESLGLTKTQMSFMLQDYLTAEEFDDQRQIERLNQIYENQGYLTEADMENVSPTVYAEFARAKKIRAEKLEDISTANNKEAVDTIRAFTGRRIKLEEGQPEPEEFVRQYNNAYRAYKQYMTEYMLGGMTQDEAQARAIKRLKENDAANSYTVHDYRPTSSSKFYTDLSSARSTLISTDFNAGQTIIPNSEPYLEQLDKWNSGQGAFPRFYNLAAANNKRYSGWNLAAQQYRLKYGRELGKDARRQAFESQDDAVQDVLNFHPTPKKLARATTTSFKPLPTTLTNPLLKRAADIVSNYESAGSGGYNAVNQIGLEGGTKVKGYSGDFRNMKQHGGKAMTDLTVGEVLDLGADPGKSVMSDEEWIRQGKIHAAGRYQFIHSTLKGLVKRLGISRSEKFSPELQDRLFLSLLKSGGLGQWVGPSKYATEEEKALIRRAKAML